MKLLIINKLQEPNKFLELKAIKLQVTGQMIELIEISRLGKITNFQNVEDLHTWMMCRKIAKRKWSKIQPNIQCLIMLTGKSIL